MLGITRLGPEMDEAEKKQCWASPGWARCSLRPASPSQNAPRAEAGDAPWPGDAGEPKPFPGRRGCPRPVPWPGPGAPRHSRERDEEEEEE